MTRNHKILAPNWLSVSTDTQEQIPRRALRRGSYEKKMPEPRTIYVVDFFCGCGGMSWGFANTRQSHLTFEVLAGLDIDTKSLATYERNIGAPGLNLDVAELATDPAVLLSHLPLLRSLRPLLFIGCAPCQGFSAHRKKDDRDDSRNNLMVAFADICQFYKPDVVVMENVPEIVNGRFAHYFDAAKERLEQNDYRLDVGVLDLSLYGVPQRRRRAVVLGALNANISLPSPLFDRDSAPTVRDAIAHLRPIEAGETDPYDPWHRAPEHTARILERITKTPPDGGDRRDLSKTDQLECHASVDVSSTPGFTDVYGRLRWDTPAVTITAKSSTPSCGRFLHPEQHRNISVREAAILQGFPQGFEFEGPLVHLYRQIGEAVPPAFARHLAWQVLDFFSPRDKNAVPVFANPADVRRARNEAFELPRLKVVDAFCGAGGLALGFEAAGIDPVFAFDTDAAAVTTFSNSVRSVVHQADVCDPELPSVISQSIGRAPFILVGGPPCQGFSQQRRGEDEDPRNNLVVRFAEMVNLLNRQPEAIVLENVTYLDSPRGRDVLAQYSKRLEGFGYKLFRHDLNSADYGVPQLRRRILVVALRAEYAAFYEGPLPLTSQRWPTVGEALIGLPHPGSSTLLSGMTSNHHPAAEGALNRRRIAYVDMGEGRLCVPPDLQLACHARYDGHLDVYGRLDWFAPSRTITGGFDSFTRGEFGHPFRHRSITPREAARLQGFPDWFVFAGNRSEVRRQIGNAVPPPMAYALALGIANAVDIKAMHV